MTDLQSRLDVLRRECVDVRSRVISLDTTQAEGSPKARANAIIQGGLEMDSASRYWPEDFAVVSELIGPPIYPKFGVYGCDAMASSGPAPIERMGSPYLDYALDWGRYVDAERDGLYIKELVKRLVSNGAYQLSEIGHLELACRVHHEQTVRWIEVVVDLLNKGHRALYWCVRGLKAMLPFFEQENGWWPGKLDLTRDQFLERIALKRWLLDLANHIGNAWSISHPDWPEIAPLKPDTPPSQDHPLPLERFVESAPQILKPLALAAGLDCAFLARKQEAILQKAAPVWWRWEVLGIYLHHALHGGAPPEWAEVQNVNRLRLPGRPKSPAWDHADWIVQRIEVLTGQGEVITSAFVTVAAELYSRCGEVSEKTVNRIWIAETTKRQNPL